MTELMRHPEVMQKAQEEIRTTVDGKKGRVKEGDIEQLHYMKCVIKEIFRLHPPVPLLVQRETIRRCVIDGFDIPAKTRVIVNAFAVGREAGSWENPEEFRPERFMDCSIDLKGHDFELIPFGAGRRICPGMHVGMAVVELALANLLYAFDWELPEGVKKEDISMEEAVGITVHRKNDLCLMATKYAGITAD